MQALFDLSNQDMRGKILEFDLKASREQASTLPFTAGYFDYAVSTQVFFVNATPQSLAWHVERIRELARVAKEVRIFPLVDQTGQVSGLLGPVLLALQQANYGVEVRALDPEGHAMLRVWAKQCVVICCNKE